MSFLVGLITCEDVFALLEITCEGWLLVIFCTCDVPECTCEGWSLVRIVPVLYMSFLVRVDYLWRFFFALLEISCEGWLLVNMFFALLEITWGLITCDFLYMCCAWVYLWGLVTCDKFLLAHVSKPVLELYLWRYMFDTVWWLVFTMGGQQFELLH